MSKILDPPLAFLASHDMPGMNEKMDAELKVRIYCAAEDDDEDEEDDDDEYDDAESILDAIVAIEDLHRAGKISDEAYQKRRAELKSAL